MRKRSGFRQAGACFVVIVYSLSLLSTPAAKAQPYTDKLFLSRVTVNDGIPNQFNRDDYAAIASQLTWNGRDLSLELLDTYYPIAIEAEEVVSFEEFVQYLTSEYAVAKYRFGNSVRSFVDSYTEGEPVPSEIRTSILTGLNSYVGNPNNLTDSTLFTMSIRDELGSTEFERRLSPRTLAYGRSLTFFGRDQRISNVGVDYFELRFGDGQHFTRDERWTAGWMFRYILEDLFLDAFLLQPDQQLFKPATIHSRVIHVLNELGYPVDGCLSPGEQATLTLFIVRPRVGTGQTYPHPDYLTLSGVGLTSSNVDVDPDHSARDFKALTDNFELSLWESWKYHSVGSFSITIPAGFVPGSEARFTLHFDPAIGGPLHFSLPVSGWPYLLPERTAAYRPSSDDLDGDGSYETVFTSAPLDKGNLLTVLNSDGTLRFSRKLADGWFHKAFVGEAVSSVPGKEVVIGAGRKLSVFNGAGQLIGEYAFDDTLAGNTDVSGQIIFGDFDTASPGNEIAFLARPVGRDEPDGTRDWDHFLEIVTFVPNPVPPDPLSSMSPTHLPVLLSSSKIDSDSASLLHIADLVDDFSGPEVLYRVSQLGGDTYQLRTLSGTIIAEFGGDSLFPIFRHSVSMRQMNFLFAAKPECETDDTGAETCRNWPIYNYLPPEIKAVIDAIDALDPDFELELETDVAVRNIIAPWLDETLAPSFFSAPPRLEDLRFRAYWDFKAYFGDETALEQELRGDTVDVIRQTTVTLKGDSQTRYHLWEIPEEQIDQISSSHNYAITTLGTRIVLDMFKDVLAVGGRLGPYLDPPVIADINTSNPGLEIVTQDFETTVTAVDSLGRVLWSNSDPNPIDSVYDNSGIVVADLHPAPGLETAHLSTGRNFRVLGAEGQLLAEAAVPGQFISASPVAADFDGDGELEVAFGSDGLFVWESVGGSFDHRSRLYIYSGNAQEELAAEMPVWAGDALAAWDIAVAPDTTGDGRPDLIFGDFDSGFVHCIDFRGRRCKASLPKLPDGLDRIDGMDAPALRSASGISGGESVFSGRSR